MKQFKYNKIRNEYLEFKNQIIEKINNHNFILNDRLNLNMINDNNKEIATIILKDMGYILFRELYPKHEHYRVHTVYFISPKYHLINKNHILTGEK